MFIRPRGIAAVLVYHSKNSVRPHEVPRIHRLAALVCITDQPRGINRSKSSVGGRRARCAAVQQCLINIDSSLVFGSRSVGLAGFAGSACNTFARCMLWRRKYPVIGHVVVNAEAARTTAAHDR